MSFQRPLDYIDVATRLREMREKYPDLTMSQVSLEFRNFGGKDWVVYTAAAYRTPDDQRPGIGTAWEPVPGPTNFTRDSEVQNAETAAWGRALVAIGADTKNGIASSEEVSNRSGEQPQRNYSQTAEKMPVSDDIQVILDAAESSMDTFLVSLAEQYRERGTLTKNQITKGAEKARRFITTPRSAPTVAPSSESPWPDEAPF